MTNATRSELGAISVSNEVVAKIAGIAAAEIEGVESMSGGLNIAELLGLGGKDLDRGVRVEIGDTEVAITLFVNIEFGYNIPEVCVRVQEHVKKTVEAMTGLRVVSVDVAVRGVHFPEREEAEPSEERQLK